MLVAKFEASRMRLTLIAALFLTAGVANAAAPAIAPLPPPAPPPQTHLPPSVPCVDPRDTAEYIPGVDANGRQVAPADLPGSSTDVQISTQVYAELRSTNPQLRGAGVMANLPGLRTPPVCPPRQSAPKR
jgi:hypothetical protein